MIYFPARIWFAFVLYGFGANSGDAASIGFHAQYIDLGSHGTAAALATDNSGNHFIISSVTESSGAQRMRATKTDSQGNTFAIFDFGTGIDTPHAAVVDPQGNLIVVGATLSPAFPTAGSAPGAQMAFAVKLDGALTKILSSVILGGTANAYISGSAAKAVTVDGSGAVFVAGSTDSTDFPVSPGAYQTKPPTPAIAGRPVYAFLVKLSADLKQIVWSTYFGSDATSCVGGSGCIGQVGITTANTMTLDSARNIVIAGTTNAYGLPTTPGAYSPQCVCDHTQTAGFVSKFSADGSQLMWSTFLSAGSSRLPFMLRDVKIKSLSLDGAGNVVVGGSAPDGFPVISGALQANLPASGNTTYGGFLSELDSSGAHLLASTYFGGAIASPGVQSLAIDSMNHIWVTGQSDPAALPGTPAALGIVYVAAVTSDLSSVVDLQTAPAGAASTAINLDRSGGISALGPRGSLLLANGTGSGSVVGAMNAAGSGVSGVVAPGEILSLYGYALGPTPALSAQITNGVVANSLGGYQVLFNGIAAPLLYLGANQVNCVVPVEIYGLDAVTVQVVTPQETVPGPNLFVAPSQPALFHDAQGFALALNADGTINSSTNPAAAGSIVSVWGTGAGLNYQNRTDGMILPNQPSEQLMLPISMVTTGPNGGTMKSLEILYAGDAPGSILGLIQINFRLPQSTGVGSPPLSVALQAGAEISSSEQVYMHP